MTLSKPHLICLLAFSALYLAACGDMELPSEKRHREGRADMERSEQRDLVKRVEELERRMSSTTKEK